MASAAADDAILSRFISKRVNSKGLIDPPPPRDLAKKKEKGTQSDDDEFRDPQNIGNVPPPIAGSLIKESDWSAALRWEIPGHGGT